MNKQTVYIDTSVVGSEVEPEGVAGLLDESSLPVGLVGVGEKVVVVSAEEEDEDEFDLEEGQSLA